MNKDEVIIAWEFFRNIEIYYFVTSKKPCFYCIDTNKWYIRDKFDVIFLPHIKSLSEEELFQNRTYWDKEHLIDFDELVFIQNYLSTNADTIKKDIEHCIKNNADKMYGTIKYFK